MHKGGSYVIVRRKRLRQQLVKMAKLDSYCKEDMVAALEHFSRRYYTG